MYQVSVYMSIGPLVYYYHYYFPGVLGQVKWTGNWITFFDNITQLSIREIANNMVLPRDFKCIIIDPVEQERKVQKYGPGKL